MAIASLDPKPLAQGQLPGSKGTLYTAPSGCLLLRGTLTNVTAGAVTVNLYLKTAAGSSRRLLDTFSIAAHTALEVALRGHVLDTGGLLEGDASAATSIDYYFSGVEFA